MPILSSESWRDASRRIAELTAAPFVDLDARIESRTGLSIAELFRRDGEAAFRTLERAELDRVLDEGLVQVIALGGGALVERSRRLSALDRAVVVTLEAPIDVLLTRAALAGPLKVSRAC